MDNTNKKNKLILCLTMGVLIISSQIIDSFYISKNINNDYMPYDINNNEVISSYFDNSIFMIKTARGYYGIVNSNGREVISPIWNSISVLSKDKFIVGRVLDSASVSVGILDDYENVIIPLIFSSITQENDYFKVGTLNQNGKKIFFDKLGNIQLYQEWDSYEIDGDTAKVTKDNITAVITADEDGKCSYSSLYIPSSIFDKDFSVTIKNPIFDGVSALDDYSNVVEKLSQYCEALFNSDTDSIRSITNSQYYNSLISNILSDCKLSHVSNILVYGRNNSDLNSAVVYYAEIKLTYTSKSALIDDTETQEMNTMYIKTEFVRSQDGSIILRSAEKILDEDEDQTNNADYYSNQQAYY